MARTPMHLQRPQVDAIEAASGLAAVEVAPRIWRSSGLSNSYLVQTSAGRVIINAGVPFESLVHQELFDKIDSSPTSHIIVTQGHPDHFGGIDTFREMGTEVIAQANWPFWREEYYVGRLDAFRARAGFAWADKVHSGMANSAARFGEPLPGLSDPTPTIVVQDFLELEIGDRRLQFYATSGGETTDSMVVLLPEESICFTGNLFGPLFGHLPNLVTLRGDRYRDPVAYLDSLELVRSLQAETLITGHFDPIVGADVIDDELRRMGEAVRLLVDGTLDGMNSGRDVETLMREVVVPAELGVGEGYGKASWNVRAIWEMYAGWFHHRSTTELYGVPRSSVYGDILELAGVEALVDRAEARLAAGEPLAAIHLLDLVVAELPAREDALKVYREAHRLLLADATNFWERAWLRREAGGG
jgi:glyoxylase-like metal-dependent hydrolase (beta-lactamase superfamily II)